MLDFPGFSIFIPIGNSRLINLQRQWFTGNKYQWKYGLKTWRNHLEFNTFEINSLWQEVGASKFRDRILAFKAFLLLARVGIGIFFPSVNKSLTMHFEGSRQFARSELHGLQWLSIVNERLIRRKA